MRDKHRLTISIFILGMRILRSATMEQRNSTGKQKKSLCTGRE